VRQVAAAFPGGDPLAAALAAGETPSPEMVAASGETEGLRPAVAWVLLAGVIVLATVADRSERGIFLQNLAHVERALPVAFRAARAGRDRDLAMSDMRVSTRC
jgi:hypothetical protein